MPRQFAAPPARADRRPRTRYSPAPSLRPPLVPRAASRARGSTPLSALPGSSRLHDWLDTIEMQFIEDVEPCLPGCERGFGLDQPCLYAAGRHDGSIYAGVIFRVKERRYTVRCGAVLRGPDARIARRNESDAIVASSVGNTEFLVERILRKEERILRGWAVRALRSGHSLCARLQRLPQPLQIGPDRAVCVPAQHARSQGYVRCQPRKRPRNQGRPVRVPVPLPWRAVLRRPVCSRSVRAAESPHRSSASLRAA